MVMKEDCEDNKPAAELQGEICFKKYRKWQCRGSEAGATQTQMPVCGKRAAFQGNHLVTDALNTFLASRSFLPSVKKNGNQHQQGQVRHKKESVKTTARIAYSLVYLSRSYDVNTQFLTWLLVVFEV